MNDYDIPARKRTGRLVGLMLNREGLHYVVQMRPPVNTAGAISA